jgi:hypothetical protein
MMMKASMKDPKTSANMHLRLPLYWIFHVAMFGFCQFAILSTTCLFDAGSGDLRPNEASEKYPHFGDATYSALRASAVSSRKRHIESFYIDDFYRDLHQQIDSIPPIARCAAVGVEPQNELTPRRIFFGSMLADENMDVIKVMAIETHGIYEVMALVESNTTYMGTPRKLRFRGTPEADLLQHSNMFGNQTRVIVDYWLEDMPDLKGMVREVEQRNSIVKIWKEAGMTERDVAVLADLDEIVSRDFLRALQVCDFPQLRLQRDQPSCQAPKLVLSTIQFEASPFCIKRNEWYHPDVILVSTDNRSRKLLIAISSNVCLVSPSLDRNKGQCIEGIGDPSERVVPLREFRRKYGGRSVTCAPLYQLSQACTGIEKNSFVVRSRYSDSQWQ